MAIWRKITAIRRPGRCTAASSLIASKLSCILFDLRLLIVLPLDVFGIPIDLFLIILDQGWSGLWTQELEIQFQFLLLEFIENPFDALGLIEGPLV